MLESSSIDLLQDKKNLLAFSAGVDSTALFFLLLQHNIKFDIAIVNYGQRDQSEDEVLYASELAKKHKLSCYTYNAKTISRNFESKAREIRYDFFNSLIDEQKYENLLTAHHLGDRFEWMLMQFCKGAGCAELSGMRAFEKRENYQLVRPLLHLDKSELLTYLNDKNIKYFVDETNFDESIKRNYFRQNITKPLLEKHLSGIKKSFDYIDADRDELIQELSVNSIDDFRYFNSANKRSDIYTIDKELKSLGHIITAEERKLLQSNDVVVVGRKYLIVQQNSFIFISPYQDKDITILKKDKEFFRSLKIEPKLRPYLYKNEKAFNIVKNLISVINLNGER